MRLASLFLAMGLTLATVRMQRPDATLCQGLLGAGFPASFVCDASGESPLSSVGQIDWADLDSVNFAGAFIDILFFALMLSGGWFVVRRIVPAPGRPND